MDEKEPPNIKPLKDMSAITDVAEAAHVLQTTEKEQAALEALTRAMICEHQDKRDKSLFWVNVFNRLTRKETGH